MFFQNIRKIFPFIFNIKSRRNQTFKTLFFSTFSLTILINILMNSIAVFLFSGSIILSANPSLAQTSINSGFNPQQWLLNALQWIDSLGAMGAIAFILIYVIATVAFLPGSILTLGAGVVFGIFWGSIYVFIGATIGATLAFLVGRYIARGWVASKIEGNKKFQAIDEAVGREGLKIVLLTRLSPVFPFNLLNYAYGVTRVTLKDYVIASVGMFPGTIMYVYIGSLAGNLATIGTQSTSVNPVAQWSIRIIGFLATVAVTVYITKIAKKALDKSILDEV